MRPKFTKTYYHKVLVDNTDNEGSKYRTYSSTATAITADIQPASGKVQAEQYGARLGYILNMIYDGAVVISEGDGICVYIASTASPDYKVISVKKWSSHRQIELEKVL
jgi:hypothetical protein